MSHPCVIGITFIHRFIKKSLANPAVQSRYQTKGLSWKVYLKSYCRTNLTLWMWSLKLCTNARGAIWFQFARIKLDGNHYNYCRIQWQKLILICGCYANHYRNQFSDSRQICSPERCAKKLYRFHLNCLRKYLKIKWQDKIPYAKVVARADMMNLHTLICWRNTS